MWDCGTFHMELSILRSIVPKRVMVTFFISKLVGILKFAYSYEFAYSKEIYWSHSEFLPLEENLVYFLSLHHLSIRFSCLVVLRDPSNTSIHSAFHNLIPRWLRYMQESDFWRVILNPLWSVQWAPHKEFDTGCDIWIEASISPAEPCSPLRHGGARGLRRRRQSVATSGARNSHISYIQRPVYLKSHQVVREGREFCEIFVSTMSGMLVDCGGCRTPLGLPPGAQSVRCALCGYVTPVATSRGGISAIAPFQMPPPYGYHAPSAPQYTPTVSHVPNDH